MLFLRWLHRSAPFRGWRKEHVHVLDADFCIPRSRKRYAYPGQHSNRTFVRLSIKVFTHLTCRSRGAVRFFVRWLFLHRRLRLRQRGPFLLCESRGTPSAFQGGYALTQLIIPEERQRFLSRQLGTVSTLRLLRSLASLSASI